MKKRKIMWRVLKRTGTDKLLYGFILFYFVIAVAIWFVEPEINSLFDSIWYCYSVFTTIGFGDYISVTLVGRVLSIILSLYSILMLAVIPGVIVSFYMESLKIRSKESMEKFMFDLERLPELSKEELEQISQKVKEFNKNT